MNKHEYTQGRLFCAKTKNPADTMGVNIGTEPVNKYMTS